VFVVLIAFALGVAAGLLAGALRASRLKRELKRVHRAGASSPAPQGERPRTGA